MLENIFAAWMLVGTLGLLIFPCSTKAQMYTFVDEKGVMHFSNVPTDSRYKLIRSKRLSRKKYSKLAPGQCSSHIEKAARRYGVDPCLVKAVIKMESNFNCRAVSKKGAQGLMQLMPGTARDMRVANPFDPKDNIFGGTRYLRKMIDLFQGDVKLALAAYNAGPERVKALGRIPPFPETMNYVDKVLYHYQKYKITSPDV
ncbi:MAG: transglycosylase SLT domain-containing protein [Thermodesulfobacteriota bacterium]|nr:transglycosylase SLT domain-containing protein [Thermodesulfobacteriota bacterium]